MPIVKLSSIGFGLLWFWAVFVAGLSRSLYLEPSTKRLGIYLAILECFLYIFLCSTLMSWMGYLPLGD